MEEKKLTDEEIVIILEECFFGDVRKCCECKLYNGEGLGSCMKNVARPTLDLIHRLQDEKQKMFDSCVDLQEQINTLRLENNKQKTEIERLTKGVKRLKKRYEETIKRNVDECVKKFCETTMYAEQERLVKENAELQKQVDELKLDLENWKKAAYGYKYAEEQAVKDTAKEIISLLEDMVLRQLKERCGIEVE